MILAVINLPGVIWQGFPGNPGDYPVIPASAPAGLRGKPALCLKTPEVLLDVVAITVDPRARAGASRLNMLRIGLL